MPTLLSPSALHPVLDLLTLLYHRNKNQHRHSKWWKHLSLLRRNLTHLHADQQSLATLKVLNRAATATQESNLEARIRAREVHLCNRIMGGCYSAFRLLATEGRFVPLGMVLLGVLADVVKVLPPATVAMDSRKRSPAQKANLIEMSSWDGAEGEHVDLGERVERQEEGVGEKLTTVKNDSARDENRNGRSSTREHKEIATPMVLPTARPKKKKRKANAIDDLFSGLT